MQHDKMNYFIILNFIVEKELLSIRYSLTRDYAFTKDRFQNHDKYTTNKSKSVILLSKKHKLIFVC